MRRPLLTLFVLLLSVVTFAQGGSSEKVVSFRFVPGDDMFYIPWSGNNDQLESLYSLVDQYRAEITSGKMPVYVDGYTSSMKSAKRNLDLSFIRANRVKSELIKHKGLSEDNFVTKNYATSYNGIKDMVVVTLRIPAKEEPQPEPRPEPKPEPRPEPVTKAKPTPRPEPTVAPAVDPWKYPYCFALRTNLLYDAFLLPTLGVEWRVNRNVGLKLDAGLSWWGDEKGKVQKIWFLNPEVRWYMGQAKRFYLGVGGNYAEYNTYGYLLGKLWSESTGYGGYKGDTGYEGSLWNAGVTVGYQLPLSRNFAIDFNLGLGYTKSEYDSFNIINDTRVYNKKDQSKDFWGPTQAGINLVWKLGRP